MANNLVYISLTTRTRTALLILLASCVLPGPPAFAAFPQIGFQSAQDLFECSPPDSISFDQNTMQWDMHYLPQQYKWCSKEIPVNPDSKMDGISFRIKSDAEGPLWLQIEEVDGEGYYKLIFPGNDWSTESFPLSAMTLNDDKVANGKLDVNKISKILVLDSAGLEGAKGRRSVWFSDWKWTSTQKTTNPRPTTSPSATSPPTEAISRITKSLSTGKVGLSAVPPSYKDTIENWKIIFSRAEEIGVQLLSAGNAQWTDEIEPQPGIYSWESYDRFFSVLESNHHKFELSFDLPGFFFHADIQKPSHLPVKSITDPTYLKHYKRMLTSFLDRFGPKIDYIVIHAEGAYSYFEKHPDHMATYTRLLRQVGQYIKQHSPHILLGVNTDPFNKTPILSPINNAVDFMAYDIFQSDDVQSPAELEPMIQKLIQIGSGKKIAIQNGGWSTSRLEGSTEQQQVDFIREFYRLLYKYREQIEYASFYLLYDEDIEFMTPLYKSVVPDAPDNFLKKMVESNARFGLFHVDGSPKPGWSILKEEVNKYYKNYP